MKRTKSLLALALAASMPVSGCATTHLGGAYRTSATDVALKQDMRTLDEGSCVPLFWGLFVAGSYDANKELAKKLRPDEEVTSLEVKERLSVGGFFLWLITAGIVSHHTIEVRGHTSVASRPPAETPATSATTPTRERETIVTPAAPAPAGYREKTVERDTAPVIPAVRPDKSGDWNEGYRDGTRDRGHVAITGDGPARPDKSADYNEGYREAIRGH